jgi:hypothetical protein
MGIMLQEGGFPPDLTVAETGRMWAGTLSAPRPVAEALGLVSLGHRAGVAVRSLSGGERRRLDLAMAILGRLDEVPGIGPVATAVLIAEVGLDMSRFPARDHLASWAKYAPGVSESAGKKKGKNATGHGNPYLARILGEAAIGAARTDTSSASATGGSPAAGARTKPSSRSATPSWSSSGACYLTPTSATPTSARTFTTPGSATAARCATTSASLRPSDTRSPWKPPPDLAIHTHPAPLTLRRVLPRAHLGSDFRIS